MARTSKIEWTEHTWNPIVGCSVESAGCTNCYAMRMARRLEGFGQPAYQGLTKSTKGGPVWTGVIRQASDAQINKPARISPPSIIFVNSMSDLFHPDAEDQWRDDAYSVMRRVDRHTYQVLTKRPQVARAYYDKRPAIHRLPQIWMGVSVELADVRWRIDELREIPASVRFLSIEPLIGPVGEMDDDPTNEHRCPPEHVLKQMQVCSPLVEGAAAMQFPRREAVHGQPEHRYADHAQAVRFGG